jgi:hypothetical protein
MLHATPFVRAGLALAALLAGSVLLADEPASGSKKDTDKKEPDNPVLAQLMARFDAWDTNKDGFLDKDELTKALGENRAKRALELYDKDSDGKISKDEYTAWAKAYVKELTGRAGDGAREGGRREGGQAAPPPRREGGAPPRPPRGRG